MKASLKCFSVLMLLLGAAAARLEAGQQIFLSTSPNERYRVYVEQVLDRRVGDRVFFRYPISLVNVKRPDRHFFILNAGSPFITETDKQTFTIKWAGGAAAAEPTPNNTLDPHGFNLADHPAEPSSIHFSWSPDSLKFFMRLEVIEGLWRTYFVDVNTGKAKDITAEIEKGLSAEVKDKTCDQPKVELVQWTKPHLAFLKLTSDCGNETEKISDKHSLETASVLFDSDKGEVVADCVGCKDPKALKKFDKYYIKSIPTPTPTPEETPTAQ